MNTIPLLCKATYLTMKNQNRILNDERNNENINKKKRYLNKKKRYLNKTII